MSWYYIDAWIKYAPTWGQGGSAGWEKIDSYGPRLIQHGAASTIAEVMASTRPNALVRKFLWQGGTWSQL